MLKYLFLVKLPITTEAIVAVFRCACLSFLILKKNDMETTKTFQFKITYLENGAVKTEQYDKEFTPFELLGIITHIKNEIEVDLLQLSKPKTK